LDHANYPHDELAWWRGQPVASGSDDSVIIYDPETGRQQAALIAPGGYVRQFLVAGDHLYAAEEGLVFRWDWPLP